MSEADLKHVIGLGAGGHAKVVIEILNQYNGYEISGLLDANPDLWGEKVMGISVLGDDNYLNSLYDRGIRHAFIGIGSTGDTSIRRQLFEKAQERGFEIISAIHPQSTISPSAELGRGATIMPGAIINSFAKLGDNVIVNSGAIVEHDCTIGNHVHIATGAVIASTVEIGEGSHIGAGSTIRQSITIGHGVIVGAGSAVVTDISDDLVVGGIPAKILRELGHQSQVKG